MAMNFNLPEYEQLVSCPYNKAHQVVQHRMAHHIIKCKRSHGGHGFKECMFNTSHIFPDAEIAEHEATCPERAAVEKFLLSDQSRQRSHIELGDSGITCASSFIDENNEDDWDNDPPVPTYNPRKSCLSSDIVMDVKHGTPSQRKQKREKEYQRLSQIRGMSASNSRSSMDS